MIRENQKYLNRLQVCIDLCLVVLSFLIAYYIRFYILSSGFPSFSLRQYGLPILISLPCYLLLYHTFDLYSTRRTKPMHHEISAIVQTNTISVLMLTVGLFVFRIIDYSRLTILIFFIVNIFFTIGIRIFIRFTLRKYRRLGYNLKHCLIIGISDGSSEFIKKAVSHPHWGYSIRGVMPMSKYEDDNFLSFPIIGTISNLESILTKQNIDYVVLGIGTEDMAQLGHIISICEKTGVKTHIIPYYYKYIPAKPYMDDLDGLPMIDIRHVPLDNIFKSFLKRAFDIVFSLFAIVLTSPFLVFAAIMTKLTSKGPILFRQERVGLGRKPFYMYKFRSMRVQSSEEEKLQWTTKDDPRKTAWGTFMRRTSIDELPQFFNVLLGDMSIVGPRPERPVFVDKFKEDIPKYMIKHQVRPGITGWAQVNGLRGDTSIEDRITHDLYYIENWTFGFDIKIIFHTVLKGFINKNAY
ncbi:MAG: undecaprenyl-phosphate glucose phosphotransferase [Cellulosilyticaceae bacterium]